MPFLRHLNIPNMPQTNTKKNSLIHDIEKCVGGKAYSDYVIAIGADYGKDTKDKNCVTFAFREPAINLAVFTHFMKAGMVATSFNYNDPAYLYLYRVNNARIDIPACCEHCCHK
jgi:hypothetical protein